jgi:rhodanese-related sulfurtransferase
MIESPFSEAGPDEFVPDQPAQTIVSSLRATLYGKTQHKTFNALQFWTLPARVDDQPSINPGYSMEWPQLGNVSSMLIWRIPTMTSPSPARCISCRMALLTTKFALGCGRLCAVALALAFSIFAIAGCKNGTSGSNVVLVSPAQGQELMESKGRLLGLAGKRKVAWVDPRTAPEFRAGHIPGALNLPYERLAQDHKKLDEYDTIIVYGDDYNDPKAIGFSKRMIEYGHGDVRTLNGGLRAWKSDGNTLESGG